MGGGAAAGGAVVAGHPDPERLAAEFSGTERTVAEYLLAEVLDRQGEAVRRLLLRTSILERVNGELAGGSGYDSAPGSSCSRGRALAGAQVASRRKARHGSSRTVFHEGSVLSPGDTDAPTEV